MAAVKVGVAGCGRIARLVHLNVLRRMRGVEVVALAEPDLTAREQARRLAPGAASLEDYQELLSSAQVEAVVISLPPALHAEAAVAALEAGKHIYLEKPLAISLEEGHRVRDTWRRSTGLVAMIGFNYRFHAAYQTARHWLQSAMLGTLLRGRSSFLSGPRTLPDWKEKRCTGGGVLLDLTSHQVDLVPFVLGQPVREVVCRTLQSARTEGDTVTLELRLDGGLPVECNSSFHSIESDTLLVEGAAGYLSVDRHRSRLEIVWKDTRRPAEIERPHWVRKILNRSNEPSYQAALAHFVAAVRERRPARPDFEDGYRSLAVIAAAEESARNGCAVAIPDEDSAGS